MIASHDVILILCVGMRLFAGQLNAIAWDPLPSVLLLQCAFVMLKARAGPSTSSLRRKGGLVVIPRLIVFKRAPAGGDPHHTLVVE
jgi:hypothetical protein